MKSFFYTDMVYKILFNIIYCFYILKIFLKRHLTFFSDSNFMKKYFN